MAEEVEGTEANGDARPVIDPAAMAFGLTAAGRQKADAFLDTQIRLASVQTEHLHEQREVLLSRLKLSRFNELLKASLQVMLGLVGAMVVITLAVMAWHAHQDHALVVEPFSVPPDLSQKGLTGEVAATHFLDRLSDLQSQTATKRPLSSYANAWDNDIKLEIPETGVSIGELNRYLHEWLGHETRISAEVVRVPAGLSVTARAAGAAAHTVQGPDTDPNALIQQAADEVFAETQPYRWGIYLQSHGKVDEAVTVYATLTGTSDPGELEWAYVGWSSALNQQGKLQEAATRAYEGLRRTGPSELAYESIAENEAPLEHAQAEFNAGRPNVDVASGETKAFTQAMTAQLQGDYRAAADILSGIRQYVVLEGQPDAYDIQLLEMKAETLDHNIGRAHRLDGPATTPRMTEYSVSARADGELDLGECWTAAHNLELAQARLDPTNLRQAITLQRTIWPRLAFAYAQLGRQRQADELIAKTPLDCDSCLIMRAKIATRGHSKRSADRWFGAVATRSPSIPFADIEWGKALLAREEPDAAIAKFMSANSKGPHFADPLEGWGEALMAKNRSDVALAKFAEAEKFAPNWGRLHLKWGEALEFAGHNDDARKQYQAATMLALSIADRAELERKTAGKT